MALKLDTTAAPAAPEVVQFQQQHGRPQRGQWEAEQMEWRLGQQAAAHVNAMNMVDAKNTVNSPSR